jgi:hypothetical protein
MAMSCIPLHLQRKFEQRWTARFVQPVAAAPKSIGPKSFKARASVDLTSDGIDGIDGLVLPMALKRDERARGLSR